MTKIVTAAVLSGILFVLVGAGATRAAIHPWLPPFGLDKIGTQADGPALEADARAIPEHLINPVDLGTILVPHDWLLLASGGFAVVDIAIFSRVQAIPDAKLTIAFDGGSSVEKALNIPVKQRVTQQMKVSLGTSVEYAALHVTLSSAGKELWKKDIPIMVAAKPPQWPTFGAVETQLRYDASISVQDRQTKKYSAIAYDQGWDPKLNDVVVLLPNGSRFVFWRGSSYIPFWAGLYNTGLTYQWAETIPPKGRPRTPIISSQNRSFKAF